MSNLPSAITGVPATAIAPAPGPAVPVAYQGAAASAPEEAGPGPLIQRTLAALNRFKWLALATTLLGALGGFVASRFVTPSYNVISTLLLSAQQTGQMVGSGRGPIRSEQILAAQGWIDLLRSFSIADSVVMKLGLYVEPKKAADTVALRNFQINRVGFRPGAYTLKVDGPRYTLRDRLGIVNEVGIAGDSIGRTVGFRWAPSKAQLGNRTIEFMVRTPRETSRDVLNRLYTGLNQNSNIIVMSFTGTVQQKPAETLNVWADEFVRVTTELKTEQVNQSSRILAAQRAEAEQRLAAAERAYSQFRIGAITLPSEALAVQSGVGGQQAIRNDPVLENYFASKYQLEAIKRDREQLERIAPTINANNVPIEALLSIASVNGDPAAVKLRNSIDETAKREAGVRILRQSLTDSNPTLKRPLAELATLRGTVVPRELSTYIGQLRQRERSIGSVVTSGAGELKQIPQRTIQSEALRRELDAQRELYASLDGRYREAELSKRSMTPDVRLLDEAVMPLGPTSDTAPRLIGLGLAAGLAAGLGIALLIDRLDQRFRYPTQITHDLKLQILGAVPVVDQTRPQSPERVAQIVEAFRSIRMNVRYACAPAPRVTLTLTSPGPHDGKSLVASNLALSFAEGGWRTVIVDGDLRRGQLHGTFDLAAGPGLVEYLEGTSLLGEVVQQTSHDNLSLVATGAKHRRGPELLGTPRMQQLIAALAAEFDAVIVDSPPLGAGTDAYALGAATSNVALVVRRAKTDLRMAKAKLEVLDQLPVQVIGAVLNEVDTEGGMYQYFSYDPDYVLVENDPPREELAAVGEGGDDDRGTGRLTAGR